MITQEEFSHLVYNNYMTITQRAAATIQNITYKDWDIVVVDNYESGDCTPDYTYIQIVFQDDDQTEWKSRKWLLSDHMTDSEIIQTIFLAIKTAEEHELRENFFYKGQNIFGPHWDLNQITNAIENKFFDLDVRK